MNQSNSCGLSGVPGVKTPSFQYVSPTDAQKAVMQVFRDKYQALYKEIEQLQSYGRGKHKALELLEESGMWLNKNITNND